MTGFLGEHCLQKCSGPRRLLTVLDEQVREIEGKGTSDLGRRGPLDLLLERGRELGKLARMSLLRASGQEASQSLRKEIVIGRLDQGALIRPQGGYVIAEAKLLDFGRANQMPCALFGRLRRRREPLYGIAQCPGVLTLQHARSFLSRDVMRRL